MGYVIDRLQARIGTMLISRQLRFTHVGHAVCVGTMMGNRLGQKGQDQKR
jgi:hypothetical protein